MLGCIKTTRLMFRSQVTIRSDLMHNLKMLPSILLYKAPRLPHVAETRQIGNTSRAYNKNT
jgi:hypothetical protein